MYSKMSIFLGVSLLISSSLALFKKRTVKTIIAYRFSLNNGLCKMPKSFCKGGGEGFGIFTFSSDNVTCACTSKTLRQDVGGGLTTLPVLAEARNVLSGF